MNEVSIEVKALEKPVLREEKGVAQIIHGRVLIRPKELRDRLARLPKPSARLRSKAYEVLQKMIQARAQEIKREGKNE